MKRRSHKSEKKYSRGNIITGFENSAGDLAFRAGLRADWWVGDWVDRWVDEWMRAEWEDMWVDGWMRWWVGKWVCVDESTPRPTW